MQYGRWCCCAGHSVDPVIKEVDAFYPHWLAVSMRLGLLVAAF
ncbi:hypothetical protein QWZ13_04440 [Reinekea marina]|nr:hypothetical protein [Reinekea marina]MDN3648153.1 hypothetical protein [Reinekea marina]